MWQILKESRDTIYTRCEVFFETYSQSHFLKDSAELINYNVKELKDFRNSSSFERCIKKKLLDNKSLDNLITKVEDFQSQFLNDSLSISRNRNLTVLK